MRNVCSSMKTQNLASMVSSVNAIYDDSDGEHNDSDDDEADSDESNETFLNPSQVESASEEPNFKCDLCDEYKAPTQNQVNNHKAIDHPLHCNVCNKLFPSKTQRRKHL